MTYELRDGWVHGELPGPGGRMYQVQRRPDGPFLELAKRPPNLVLHTTEGNTVDGAYNTLVSKGFESQWLVGEHRIVQIKPVWAKGFSSDTEDDEAMQVEVVGRSNLEVWLPPPPSLFPLVALTAMLHDNELITTGLRRPTDEWPLKLDRLPAAKEDYYRRHAGLWPHRAGVYGHVDLPNDEHWDPGSFDYPRFFKMVRDVLEGDDMTPEQKEKLARHEKFIDGLLKFKEDFQDGTETDLEGKEQAFKDGYRFAASAFRQPS
jgi:hypothetical protein